MPQSAVPDDLAAAIRHLAQEYGESALLLSVAPYGKKKTGRPRQPDWAMLKPWFIADAHDFLAGRNPVDLRSNYSIAVEFEKKFGGQSRDATRRRILAKLKKQRREAVLVYALSIAYEELPIAKACDVARQLGALKGSNGRCLSEAVVDTVKAYVEAFGEPDRAATAHALAQQLEARPPVLTGGLLHRLGVRRAQSDTEASEHT